MDATLAEQLVGSVKLLIPELILVAAACVLFVGGTVYRCRRTWASMALTAAGIAFLSWWWGPTPDATASPLGLVAWTPLASFVTVLSLAGLAVLILLAWNQVPDAYAGEFHACLLVIAAGTMLVGSANDLVLLFLALEMISIPTYVVLYLPRHEARNQEAALKYFVLSVFASALFLFGLSYLYGISGTTNLTALTYALPIQKDNGMDLLLGLALALVLAGLSFRVAAVPFHFYAPDVYQGAVPACAGLLAAIPKVAGFVALLVILHSALGLALTETAYPEVRNVTLALCWILALASMTLGNLLALLQSDVRRLLAYSSIAHAGYILVGVGSMLANADSGGQEAVLFYLWIYTAMTLGAFAVLGYLGRRERGVEAVEDLAGLWRTHPLAALALAVCLFSLTGLPPTAGFWAKLYIFFAAWSSGSTLYRVLAVALAINAALAAWYYVRLVAMMYLRPPGREVPAAEDRPGLAAAVVCGLFVLLAFVAPGWLWGASRTAAPLASGEQVTESAGSRPALAERR